MFSPTNAVTAFGLESDKLMSRQCPNLSDLAFEMELDDAEMLGALPSHAAAFSQTSSASSSPLPKTSIHAIAHQTASEEWPRERSPTEDVISTSDVMSTFATFRPMESELRSRSQSLLRLDHCSDLHAGRTPPPQ
mmetsp:Transcript_33580/g.79488  ORF Transcript_33580/g.79488 Transcript_33580/m.79488 type:complete len:135 (-) Transcript_33580:77-481(-)